MKKIGKEQKGWIAVVAVLLAVILALGITLGVATKWGKDVENLKPQKEAAATGTFEVKEPEAAAEGIAPEEKAGGISLVSAVIPVALYDEYGISPMALGAQTVTATVTASGVEELPDYMTEVSWSLAWKGSGSGTVTSYVSMQENKNTVTLSCLKAFGTQIELKCTSDFDSSKSATVTLDYEKRLTGIKASIGGKSVTADTTGTQTITATFPTEYGTTTHTSGDWISTTFLQWVSSGSDVNVWSEGTVLPSTSGTSITITPATSLSSYYNAHKGSSLPNMAAKVQANTSSSSSMDTIKRILDFYQILTASSDGLFGMGACSVLSSAFFNTASEDYHFTVKLSLGTYEMSYRVKVQVASAPEVNLQVDKQNVKF